jgi:transposase
MQGEILTGRERRRRWSHEDKAAILKEAFAPGAVVADVARRHDLRSQQIYQWRRTVLVGHQANIVGDLNHAGFVPVTVLAAAICGHVSDPASPAGATPTVPVPSESSGPIEIVLIGGRILRVPACVPCAELKRLVRALEGA